MIRVNLWPAEMWLFNIGHVSLTIGVGAADEDYASWWPKAVDLPDLVGIMTYGGPAEIVSAKDDIAREGHAAKETFSIDGLDEAAIRKAWAHFKADLRYALVFANCATTIAHLLHAGGGSLCAATALRFYTSFAWTPVEVGSYASLIQDNIAEIRAVVQAGRTQSFAKTAEHAVNNRPRLAALARTSLHRTRGPA